MGFSSPGDNAVVWSERDPGAADYQLETGHYTLGGEKNQTYNYIFPKRDAEKAANMVQQLQGFHIHFFVCLFVY